MIRSIFKFAFLGTILATMACGHTSPPTTSPVVSPSTEVVATKEVAKPTPGLVEGPSWRLTLPEGWVADKNVKKVGSATIELSAHSPSGETPVVLMVFVGDSGASPQGFIQGYLEAAEESENIKLLKGMKTNVGSSPGVIVLALRKLSDDTVIGTVDLITATPEHGYVVSCGGDPNDGNEFGPVCLKTLKTFELK